MLASCGSADEPATLEDLGLAIAADVQQGATFEVAVPILAGTTLSVATAPAGVNAAIVEASDGDSLRLSLDVDSGTPAGTYNLGLVVLRDGERQEIAWPFDVVPGVSSETGGMASGYETPEALKDELVAALLAGDVDMVRSLWPAASWEDLGTTIFDEFVPSTADTSCEMMGDSTANCLVFAQAMPFVLGLTMQQQANGMWQLSTVAYDSTN